MSTDNPQFTTTGRYTLRMQAIPEASRVDEDSAGQSSYEESDSMKEIDFQSEKASTHMGDLSYFEDPNWDDDADDIEDDSPYPEVRSAVANTDDPLMPVATVRAWVIGVIWAILIPGLNQFFIFRYPSLSVTSIVAQLISYPVGRAAAAYIPRNWTLFGFELNPGPFSIKEHVLITASVGATSAYAVDIVVVQRVYYHQVWNFSYQWLLVMSTQLIGFSIGGICRRILVDPPSMIWPANLVICALFNTLHSEHYTGVGERGGMTRERYFWCAFLCAFAWFQALSYFSWVTWIWPENPVVAQLFGYTNGLGFSILTFDWNQIAILSSRAYNNLFQFYNVTQILDRPQMKLDAKAYENYSPLYLSLSFATITATLSHAFIYYRRQIWNQARRSLQEQPDVHARLMSRYPQVPDWWYYTIFVTFFGFGVFSIELWPTQMPVWALLLALVIAFVYVIPVGIVQAITNQDIALNVITELIIGYVLPGRPITMMMFKTWGYISMAQALTFTSDLKLGHYMKVPPRQMFWAQVIGTVIAGTTQLGVQVWMFEHIPKMCEQDQPNGFKCPHAEVFGVSSVIVLLVLVGCSRKEAHIIVSLALGTLEGTALKRYFSVALVYFFLIGAIAPWIPYFISKKYPNSFMKYIQHQPTTTCNCIELRTLGFSVTGFIFQYYVRRRHFSWWTKYNYVLSAALDSGTAVAIIVIYFALQYPKNGHIGRDTIQKWWGNTVHLSGADARGTPLKTLADGETFGANKW
ncbi:opt oligopeptide transporter [Moniliophthora roreri]|nr:opt oligopeptide transporter [Moniliophthora roreri]